MVEQSALTEQRLDVWLDVACLFKTRSEAQKACSSGKVQVNHDAGKPRRAIHAGDEIGITRPLGRKQIVIVRGFAAQHIARADARALYEDITPPPTPEEIEMRRLDRLFRTPRPASRPTDKRDRRALRRLRGK